MEKNEKIVAALSAREQEVERFTLEAKLQLAEKEFRDKLEAIKASGVIPENEDETMQELKQKSLKLQDEYKAKIQKLRTEYLEEQEELFDITERAFLGK